MVPAWLEQLPSSEHDIESVVDNTPADTFGFCGVNVNGYLRRLVALYPELADGQRFFELIRSMADQATTSVVEEIRVALESRRWVLGKPDPQRYVPGDICALRAFQIATALHMATDAMDRVPFNDPNADLGDSVSRMLAVLALASDLYRAAPYFLDAAAADALSEADAPDPAMIADIRLPFPAVLIFCEHRLRPPARYRALPDELDEVLDHNPSFSTVGGPGRGSDIVRDFEDNDGQIEGVVVFAGPNGVGLSNKVLWLTSTGEIADAGIGAKDRNFGVVAGDLRRALAAPVVHNLAAAVAYAQWAAPAPPADAPAFKSDEWFDRIRHNKVRRAEERGAFAGVRVIDLARSGQPRADRTDEPARHVAPHMRRGHWRSVRVATRDEHGTIIGNTHGAHGTDWHYEGRWVPPVFVNAAARPARPATYKTPPTVTSP